MKKLEIQNLENLSGGIDGNAAACGFAVAFAICMPNPFTLIAAVGLCVTSDSQ